MKPLIYLADPHTIPDPVENTRRVIQKVEELTKLGFADGVFKTL